MPINRFFHIIPILLSLSSVGLCASPTVNSLITIEKALHNLDEFEKAVLDLSSPDFLRREKAYARLKQMGEKISPQLRQYQFRSNDYETRTRLGKIAEELEWDRISKPRIVSLDSDDITAHEALTSICQQAGFKNVIDPKNGIFQKRNSFHFKQLKFLEALDRISELTDISYSIDNESVQFYQNNSINPYVDYSGPFRINATQISSGKYLQLSNMRKNQLVHHPAEMMNLNLQIMAEPKTQILAINTISITKMVDDKGKNVEMKKEQDQSNVVRYYGGGLYRSNVQNANLSFARPVDCKLMRAIEAQAQLTLMVGTKPEITITDFAKLKGKKLQSSKYKIEIKEISDLKQYPVQISALLVAAGNGNQPHYDILNSLEQKILAKDAAGNDLQISFSTVNYNNDQSVSIVLDISAADQKTFSPIGSLQIVDWITKTKNIEFKLKDVPLP